MEIKNCIDCGRMFNYLSGPARCPACISALEDKYQQVKEYIYEHKDANLQTVAKDNNVSINQIKLWIKQERLEFSSDSSITLSCENCGSSIYTGRFCASCKNKVADSFSNMYKEPEAPKQEPKKKESPKMRFLN